MRDPISVRLIVAQAIRACRSFAKYEKRYFKLRTGWRGWENWLTVEILRRLNSENAIAFGTYPNSNEKFDIYVAVENVARVAVEIKVTYISKAELKKWTKQAARCLPDRVAKDADKLQRLPRKAVPAKLLLFAIVFEPANLMSAYKTYKRLHKQDVMTRFSSFTRCKWFDCSSGDGCIALLAMATSGTFPSAQELH